MVHRCRVVNGLATYILWDSRIHDAKSNYSLLAADMRLGLYGISQTKIHWSVGHDAYIFERAATNYVVGFESNRMNQPYISRQVVRERADRSAALFRFSR